MRPGLVPSTTTRSASSTASSMLWVTMQIAAGGEPLAGPQLHQLGAQVLGGEHVQRGERLVHQQQRPARGRARGRSRRAGACRRTAPWGRRTRSRRGRSGRSRASARSRALGGRHAARLQPELDVLLHGQPGQQREGLEHHRGAGVGAVEPAARGSSTVPVGGRRSARRCMRSRVDLPEPERPSSATISPSACRSSGCRRARAARRRAAPVKRLADARRRSRAPSPGVRIGHGGTPIGEGGQREKRRSDRAYSRRQNSRLSPTT